MNILVAGLGNIFLGDDAFGCEVARLLSARALPPEVRLVDYGIRGLDLTYALMDEPDFAILIDATPQGEAAGTLYVIEPDLGEEDPAASPTLETHGLTPQQVLRTACAMGAKLRRVLLVGCEPGDLGGEAGLMELTPPVAAALREAADIVEELVQKELLKEQQREVTTA